MGYSSTGLRRAACNITDFSIEGARVTRELPPIRKTRETLAQAFQRVLELEAEGKFDRADRLCRAILATQPNHLDALRWLRAFQKGRRASAPSTKLVNAA